MKTGEEDAAGWSTDGCSSIGVGETHALAGKAVNIWREELGVVHVTRLKVSPFVQHEVDDVGLLLFSESGGEKGEEESENR